MNINKESLSKKNFILANILIYLTFIVWTANEVGDYYLLILLVPIITVVAIGIGLLKEWNWSVNINLAFAVLGSICALFMMSSFTHGHVSGAYHYGYGHYLLPLFFITLFWWLRKQIHRYFIQKETGDEFKKKNILTNIELSTKIYFLNTIILGVILTNIFYLFLIFAETGTETVSGIIKEKLASRGSIPVVTVGIFFWAIAIMVIKGRQIYRERKAYQLTQRKLKDATPEQPLSTETIEDLFKSELAPFSDCTFPSRLAILKRCNEGYVDEKVVGDLFDRQTAIDRQLISSSYTGIRFIIWAIPVLGFIGTVWGISLSVGKLTGILISSTETGLSGQTLGPALKGLGIAFDTTLVALVLAVIAMFIASFVQKIEEDLVIKAELFIQHWGNRK